MEQKSQPQTKDIANCLVCNGNDWKKIYTIKSWEILQCTNCDFAKIDPFLEEAGRCEFYSKENIRKRSKKKRSLTRVIFRNIKGFTNNTLLKRNKNAIFVKKIHKYFPKGGSILDVGCGDGSFHVELEDKYHCYGIEISKDLANQAKKIKKLNVFEGDLLTIDFGSQKFDIIMMISSLEHLRNPLQTLKRCYDLMHQESLLLIKTINFASHNRLFAKAKWSGLRPPDHAIHFNPSNLKQLLKKAGFAKFKICSWIYNDNMYFDIWK